MTMMVMLMMMMKFFLGRESDNCAISGSLSHQLSQNFSKKYLRKLLLNIFLFILLLIIIILIITSSSSSSHQYCLVGGGGPRAAMIASTGGIISVGRGRKTNPCEEKLISQNRPDFLLFLGNRTISAVLRGKQTLICRNIW